MNKSIEMLLHTLLPHLTTRRVGRLTGKSHRVAQKWHSGEMGVPAVVLDELEKEYEKLAKSTFPHDLEYVVNQAIKNDQLHPEVIASFLAAQYKRVSGQEIE